MCLVGLVASYPADADEEPRFQRPALRRRNGVAGRRPAALPDYQPAKRQYQDAPVPRAAPVDKPKRRNTAPAPAALPYSRPAENRDNVGAASNAYGGYEAGTYDESNLKFEQGVQNQASSYNSDQVRFCYAPSIRCGVTMFRLLPGRERRPRPIRHRRPARTQQLPLRLRHWQRVTNTMI